MHICCRYHTNITQNEQRHKTRQALRSYHRYNSRIGRTSRLLTDTHPGGKSMGCLHFLAPPLTTCVTFHETFRLSVPHSVTALLKSG